MQWITAMFKWFPRFILNTTFEYMKLDDTPVKSIYRYRIVHKSVSENKIWGQCVCLILAWFKSWFQFRCRSDSRCDFMSVSFHDFLFWMAQMKVFSNGILFFFFW